MAGARATRRIFLVAVALFAAALGDAIVESIANAGLVGGHFRDDNHRSVLPALFAGAVFVVSTFALRYGELWQAKPDSNDWLARAVKSFSARSPAVDLPYVYVMQLSALFLMESGEQLADGGHLLGGTVWLGGPLLFSLCAHALIGATALLALGAFMRALARTFASLVRIVIGAIWLAITRPAATLRSGRERARRAHYECAFIAQALGRAPPLLQTPA